MHFSKSFGVVGLLACVGVVGVSSALATPYYTLATYSELRGASTNANSVVIDTDGTAYVPTNTPAVVNSVTGLSNPVRSTSVFITNSALTSGTGFSASSGISNQMWNAGAFFTGLDNNSKQVYRISKTGTITSPYVNNATLTTYTTTNGGTAPFNSTVTSIDSSGNVYFYDTKSVTIGRVTGVNSVSAPLASKATIQAQINAVTGMTVSGSTLFVSSNNATLGGIYSYAIGGSSFTQVYSPAAIKAVTGAANSTAGAAIFAAPDGQVYFFDSAAKAILSFDPLSPSNSLKNVFTTADMTGGPQGSGAFVSGFTWYNDAIAWYFPTTTAAGGLFGAVPEPGSLGMLVPAALLGLRRTRRSR